jgi:hypothetical protein
MKWQNWNRNGWSIKGCGLGVMMAAAVCGHCAETIRYFGGPRITFPLFTQPADLDLNWDGASDLHFESGSTCTASIPGSCWDYQIVTPNSGGEVLAATNYLAAIPYGTSIGNESPQSMEWTTNSVNVVVQSLMDQLTMQSPFQAAGQGYVGVRFPAADGVHYGWIKLRIQNYNPFQPFYYSQPDFDPTVTIGADGTASVVQPIMPPQIIILSGPVVNIEEWAFETRPNTPILAGAIPVPESVAVALGARVGNIRVAWSSQVGAAYQIQYKDSLSAAIWETINVQIVATATTAAAELTAGGANRFFRIVRAD